jgi:hypothetical protein
MGLRKSLPVELVNPLWRTVGRNNDKGYVAIAGLCHRWGKIEQRRARCDTNHHWLEVARERQANGIETSRALVCHGMTLYIARLIKVMNDGGVSAAWAHHRMLHIVLKQ